MKAVVMAGGEGSRLRPLTLNRPKPLVPIVNKPIMQHILELLVRHGFTEVISTLHYLADEIETYFGDGSEFGVRMRYAVEETPLGTAGSVKQAEPWLNDGTFLIISGDALTDFDLSEAVEPSAAARWPPSSSPAWKPLYTAWSSPTANAYPPALKARLEPGFSDTINTGIYILEPEYELRSQRITIEQGCLPYPATAPAALRLPGNSYWCDVGNIQAYRQAHYDALQGKVQLNIPGERREDDVWVHPDARIEPGARINGPAVIGSHATIRHDAVIEEFSILGDSCIIEREAEVHGSILWNGAYVGDRVNMSGAIIGRNCSIDRRSVLEEGVVIGDGSHLQRGSIVRAHVKIWPDKMVEAGARVTETLVWGPRWSRTLFSEGGVSGLANIEMTPDFATKLAAAYGSYLGKGAAVIISRDGHPASRMIKRALTAGLMSAGLHVQDLRSLPVLSAASCWGMAPVAAFTCGSRRTTPHDHRGDVQYRGAILDKDAQRKIENVFFREDFLRADFLGVGSLDTCRGRWNATPSALPPWSTRKRARRHASA